jgi:serine/threonine protein kinase
MLNPIFIKMYMGKSPWIDTNNKKLNLIQVKQLMLRRKKFCLPKSMNAEVANFITTLMQKDARKRPIAEDILFHPFLNNSSPSIGDEDFDDHLTENSK